jgi:hypothetical protein
MDAGRNGSVSKPAHPSLLLDTVDGFLHRLLVH